MFIDQPAQAFLDQRCQRATLRGGFAFRAADKIFGKANGRSFRHMSRHMRAEAICQDIILSSRQIDSRFADMLAQIAVGRVRRLFAAATPITTVIAAAAGVAGE